MVIALSYVITGTERQPLRLRHAHLRYTEESRSLLDGYIRELTVEDYIQHSQIERNGVWGSQNEILALAHMAGVNIFSFNDATTFILLGQLHTQKVTPDPEGYTRLSKYTGNHIVSQE